MFPVYMKLPKSKEPENDVFYIVAKNGIFLRKKNGWVDATVPVKQIAILEEQSISINLLLPGPPDIIWAKVVSFFRAVYKKYKSEAAVIIHYDHEKGWEISVPAQKVTGARARYDSSQRIEGYKYAGTVHSHGIMGASHSGTDVRDEEDQDGIHITLGDMDFEDCFSVDAEVVVNGVRMGVNKSFLDGLKDFERKTLFFSKRKFYTVDLLSLGEWTIPDEWMSQVERVSYATATITKPAENQPITAYDPGSVIYAAETYGYLEKYFQDRMEERRDRRTKKTKEIRQVTTKKEVKSAV